jgi:hypothetical protein
MKQEYTMDKIIHIYIYGMERIDDGVTAVNRDTLILSIKSGKNGKNSPAENVGRCSHEQDMPAARKKTNPQR